MQLFFVHINNFKVIAQNEKKTFWLPKKETVLCFINQIKMIKVNK